ncbi:PDZ domain-containing protein [Peribacillus muralis]|uniref:S41 family peptidase n=1 Tax=Peribacillus muralis TaxID=264697 RepID=UPI001F4DFC63|nr:S41 family peptidase [Peribacillus muralis]MCK1994435.1 S41 family peptidase [Peribacillus muralis]MCK2014780.1 S41 family peptidase [Peribacillus muralis]
MVKKWVLPLVIIISIAIGAVGGIYWTSFPDKNETTHESPAISKDKEWAKVEQAYGLIVSEYVEQVDGSRLVEGAIQGMLSALKDPYSVYMDKETAKQFNETLDSSFEGIGTEIGMEDGKVIIVSPYKDSPAEQAGLKPKDQILKVNGESVEGLDLYETRLKIRGEKGSPVKMEIKRAGVSNPLEFNMVRAEIPLDTVFSSVKEVAGEQIGYIELTTFSENTAADFKKQMKKLENEDIKGLVIDVRGNPGGLLSSVETILGEFITKEKPFMQIAERTGETQSFFTSLKKAKNYPIAVLTDKGSASASEILAGAMQEAGGYPLVGEKTFGKGTVQQAVPMGDGSKIKLTLYKWLTPSGNWIHKKGIEPTIKVKQPDFFNAHQLAVEGVLKRDMNDEQIQYAQSILKGLGFETGREDGYYDWNTEIAVKAFQKQYHLKVTGKLDPKTAAHLETAILEKIQDEDNDIQLRTALNYLVN